MGKLAEEMSSGVACEMCGQHLMCEECEDIGTAAYCSASCCLDRGGNKDQVCNH